MLAPAGRWRRRMHLDTECSCACAGAPPARWLHGQVTRRRLRRRVAREVPLRNRRSRFGEIGGRNRVDGLPLGPRIGWQRHRDGMSTRRERWPRFGEGIGIDERHDEARARSGERGSPHRATSARGWSGRLVRSDLVAPFGRRTASRWASSSETGRVRQHPRVWPARIDPHDSTDRKSVV